MKIISISLWVILSVSYAEMPDPVTCESTIYECEEGSIIDKEECTNYINDWENYYYISQKSKLSAKEVFSKFKCLRIKDNK